MGTVRFVLPAELGADGVTGLCERLAGLLAEPGVRRVLCVATTDRPGTVELEALARLQLTARRQGHRLWLADPSPEMVGLLAGTGLLELFPVQYGPEPADR